MPQTDLSKASVYRALGWSETEPEKGGCATFGYLRFLEVTVPKQFASHTAELSRKIFYCSGGEQPRAIFARAQSTATPDPFLSPLERVVPLKNSQERQLHRNLA